MESGVQSSDSLWCPVTGIQCTWSVLGCGDSFRIGAEIWHSTIGSGSTPGSRFHTPGPVYVLALSVCELDADPSPRDLCAVAAIDKFTGTTKILWGKRDGMATL